MRKLVCDRCKAELTEEDDIALAIEGSEAWQGAIRSKGLEPRGLYPCQNFIRCGGEMILVEDRKEGWWQRAAKKLRRQ